MFGLTSKIEEKHAKMARKLDRAFKSAKRTSLTVEKLAKDRPATKSSKAKVVVPQISAEEYERRCRILIERLRHSLAARYLTSESLRQQYLRAGIYSLIRSHAKKAITEAKMVPLIDHERDIRHCEAMGSAQERWRRLRGKCAELGVQESA